jgi:hypothetical protein
MRLEETFDDFELHHILRRDNEAADALARLGLSHEPPSIRLEEDVLTLMLGTTPGEHNLVPVPKTRPGKGGMILTSKANPGTLARPIGQDRESMGEIAAIV